MTVEISFGNLILYYDRVRGSTQTQPGIEGRDMYMTKLKHKLFIIISQLSARKRIETAHRINNTAGFQMMDVTDMNTRPSYRSAYGSSHNALGRQLGNGVPHYRKKPPKFNVITGRLYITF